MAMVRNRQCGSRKLLYGSKVSTPCSPRAIRYDMRKSFWSSAGVGRAAMSGAGGGTSLLDAPFGAICAVSVTLHEGM